MQQITFEIDAQRVGRASGYIGGLTIERYTFTGATIPPGTRLAILTRAGATIAAAEVAEGNTAEVDTNTQEVADLLRYQPLGACETVYITLGDADNILAIIPATIRKNWLDDEATHPPVPANRYPTKTELDEWLARFDERVAATAAAQSAAEAAASAARASATEAKRAAADAGDSAVDAEDSATAADGSKRAAEAAQGKAETAKSAAEAAQGAAQGAATSAGESAKVASASEQAALTAKQAAETAQGQAKASETAAKASETAAKGSETAASASEQAAKASEQAAAESATEAAGNASAAKASEQAAASSSTSAAESASSSATSANEASNSATAAGKSATSAAASATAAAKSATDLAEAVATAESLDGRIDALEAGTGAYIIQSRDVIPHGKPTSADVGKVLYFDGVDVETTSTLKVMNRVPFAQKVCPAPIASNEPFMCAVGCFDYVRNKKYIVFMTSLAINPIGYLYQLNVDAYNSTLTFKSKLATSYYSDQSVGAAYWCRNICVHDGYVFYTRRHSRGGPTLTICEVETGKLVLNLDLDPKDTGGIYVNSAIWYNPLSGHICVLSYAHSLATGETWTGGHFIRVFKWNAEAKTLEDIPDGDSPVTVIDVTEVFTEVFGGHTNSTYGSTWPIRDQVFVSIRGASYMALFHATADDRIEPCYEWDVEYETGEDGVTRPVWETQPEEWTDADGNVQTIQNYVRNCTYDSAIVPKMTKGRVLKFMCASDYDGVPSGTWSANPVFVQSVYAFYYSGECYRRAPGTNYTSMPVLTDGVFRWTPVAGYKFVRQEAFNTWEHLKDYMTHPRDEATGLYLLKDIRKGTARKLTGWLPKSGQYLLSVGAQTGNDAYGGGFSDTIKTSCVVALTAAQSGTPFSRIGAVYNAGTDGATMTPLPLTATYSIDWWVASMLPYCPIGFFGNVWATTYTKAIRGEL